MVRSRENTHKLLTRHAVTTLLLRADLPASAVKVCTMAMIVRLRKEAAP
jgi:hypothetical protein